jgi:hypothetical protein
VSTDLFFSAIFTPSINWIWIVALYCGVTKRST